MGSGTPLINWRPIWHRICRGKCVKWLNIKWNLRISDSWLGHQRQAMENVYIYIYIYIYISAGPPCGGHQAARRMNWTASSILRILQSCILAFTSFVSFSPASLHLHPHMPVSCRLYPVSCSLGPDWIVDSAPTEWRLTLT